MWIFYILLLVPVLLQHTVMGTHKVPCETRNRLALAFFFGILTVLVMLRHESVGNDTRNYTHIFREFAWVDFKDIGDSPLEIGYAFLNKAVSAVSGEPQVFLAVTAILTVAAIYPTYKRLCVDPSLTIVLFCTMSTFVLMFSGMRQMLAVGVGCIAYEFTRKKKLIPFLLAVMLAMSFHASAFMLFVMYPLYHIRITKRWLFAIVPALTLVLVFNKPIFTFLLSILSRYTRFDGAVSYTGAYTVLILFSLFAVFAFLVPDEEKMDREIFGLRNFLLLTLALQMFAPLHELAMRMNYYYIIFLPLLIPKIIQYKSQRWRQLALLGRNGMVVFFLVYFFVNAYRGDGNLHVFPYHFFWENVG